MNFAVIATGGKQYKVFEGHVFDIEKIDVDAGSSILLDRVLLAHIDGETLVGKPFVSSVSIHVTIQGNYRDKKVRIVKFKRRKHHMKTKNHRQTYTTLHVDKITRDASE